jgi:hypothetical protein
LTQDKHDCLTGKRAEPLGKLYYAELRTAYGSAQSPEHLLNPLNDDDPEDGRLQAALEAVFSRRRNLEPLTAYLSTVAVFNQKNTVALLKAILLLNPITSLDNNCLALSVLEYCTRHAVQNKYPHEMGVMKNYFTSALVKRLHEFRRHDLSRKDFWERHRKVAHFVMPVDAADHCFACAGHWADVEVHLAAVVQSGELGRVLFGKAWQDVAGKKVTMLMQENVAAILQENKITSMLLQAKMEDLTLKVKIWGKTSAMATSTPTTGTSSSWATS